MRLEGLQPRLQIPERSAKIIAAIQGLEDACESEAAQGGPAAGSRCLDAPHLTTATAAKRILLRCSNSRRRRRPLYQRRSLAVLSRAAYVLAPWLSSPYGVQSVFGKWP